MATTIKWDQTGERRYETGIDRGVLYPREANTGEYGKGVAWNGLISVSENPSGAEPTPLYADNIKYLNLMSVEEFGATIEAYTYPVEFEKCDGSAEVAEGVHVGQQPRQTFGLAYRTLIGNDVSAEEHGYKIHVVYGAMASPSEKSYETINETPDAITFSWELTTTPVEIEGFKPSATITIDSTKVSPENLKAIEDALYGDGSEEGSLLMPDELLALIV